MRQTHLLKLDAPYMIMWDEKNLQMCKHVATLIEVVENGDGTISTVEHVVMEDGRVWTNGTLDNCKSICREYESIRLIDFIHIVMLTPKNKWLPNDIFSINYLAGWLQYYGIDVELPGEKESDGKVLEFQSKINLGKTEEGIYWIESCNDNFYFGGRYNSLEELKQYLIYTRNEYYRAFPDKHFHITLTTDKEGWQEMLDKINAR